MPFFEWKLRRSDVPLHPKIKNSLLLPEFILNIAKNRGINSYPDFMEFAFPQFLSLPTPFALKDIDISVERIKKAILNKEKILVFGDKDADGVTATSIIYLIIRNFNGDIRFQVPEGESHYGISKTIIDEAKEYGISLIITVDCGITAIEETLYAKDLGIDIIISDHHEPLEKIPEAFALVNPKLNNYPFGYLAGAGIAFKIAQALTESYLLDTYNEELVFFDLETTGLDPEEDDIIEIAAVISKNGVIIDKFQHLIKTNKILDQKVTEITNITQDMLNKEGIDIKDALSEFLIFIKDRVLIGHNIVGFDMKFLDIQLKKHLNKIIENMPIDTLLISKILFKSLKSHTLINVGEHLGIFVDENELHRALNDVILNAEVYRRMTISQSTPIKKILSQLIPLAAIGTVADIMPLTDENRTIVSIGTKSKSIKSSTIGLLSLLKKLNILDTLDSKMIGWTLGPIINSPGRLGQASIVVDLLTTKDFDTAKKLTDLIVQKDQERKDLIASLEEEILKSTNINDIKSKKYLLITSSNISRGLTGLIASKLTNQFQVPVIIISIMENGQASGSIRSTGAFNVVTLLQNLKTLFLQFGGHKAAGGFVILTENIPKIEEELGKYMEQWSAATLKNILDIDTEIIDLSLLTIKNINYIKTLFNPIGSQNPFPNFLIKDLSLVEAKYIGKNKEHLIFTFNKDKNSFSVIAWNFSTRWDTLKNHKIFDLVGIPEINNWNNNQEVRIQLIDIEGR